VQAAAAAASSLQVTLVGEFEVVNTIDAVVEFRNAPGAGEVIETPGMPATVKLVVADPLLPAWSVAETVKLCAPAESGKLWPVVQAAAAPPSTAQVVVVEVVSLTEKFNVTGEPTVEPLAGELIVTTGLTLSTVKVTEAVPVPAALVAETITVWLPCDSPV
jgi:hypothetical protein